MPNTKNRRPFAILNRASVTLVAGLGLAAASLALAHDKPGKGGTHGKVVETDKTPKSTTSVRGKVESQRNRASEGDSRIAAGAKGRTVIGGVSPEEAKPFVSKPVLRAPRVMHLASDSAAFQVNPVNGMGMIFTPSGNPLLLQLEPAVETSGWVGQILGEELSSVLILPTKWGVTATVHSQAHGSFRMLPSSTGGATLTETNPANIGMCQTVLADAEDLYGGEATLRSGGEGDGSLAGGDPLWNGECYTDTNDSILDGPDGTSFFVRRRDLNCGAAPFVESGHIDFNGDGIIDPAEDMGVPDLVDESIRVNEIPCNSGTPITDNPPVDMIVDVLVGYSADTLEAAGSQEVILAASALDFAYMNLCLFNSEMRFRVRCVGVEPGLGYAQDGSSQLYVGSGNPARDLEFLKNNTDFFRRGLENIMIELRDERGADLVCCYVANNNTGIGGIAGPIPGTPGATFPHGGPGQNPASILTWAGAGSGTFAHEMGHLLGAQHGTESSIIEGTDAEDCPPDEVPGTAYPNRDPQTGLSIACADAAAGLLGPDCATPNYPIEYNWGYRNFIDEDDNLGFRTVMAYEADDTVLIPIPFYSNPEVLIFGVPGDGAVGSVACNCCEQGGDTAANALIMQEAALNIHGGEIAVADRIANMGDNRGPGFFPVFTDIATGGPGGAAGNHWPSAYDAYPPNFGALRYNEQGSHYVFQNQAGVAQYRCRKIPYDCNQNGYLDTLEFDGVAPNENADGLVDVNNDRVPDGCFPRECFAATSLLDPLNPNARAISSFIPEFPEDLYNEGPEGDDRLFGNGGPIPDNGVFESDLRQVPARGENDLYWAYEPSELRIDGMVHPRFSDLDIELVREDVYGEEETWTVLDCTNLAGQSGASSTLAGNYVFTLTGRPENSNDYPAATTLSAREMCTLASSGEYGNLIPGGIYRPSNDLIEFQSTPFNDRWYLRFTDQTSGAAGFFSGWSLRMKVLPYSEDCNGDGSPDTCRDAFEFDTDCNGNSLADSCEIASDRELDCDVNGVLDVCEDTSFLLDLGGPLWDADGSGVIEAAPLGGVAPDTLFIQQVLGCADFTGIDTANVCIPNCRPDLCDFIADEDLDLNQNFIIDCVEGENVFCGARLFKSSDRGLTGPGLQFSDLDILNSSIVVPVEAPDDTDDPVVSGASVLGSVKVTIYDLDHTRPSDLQITLVQTSSSGVRFTNLLAFGCSGSGYFEIDGVNGTEYNFSAAGSQTLCEASQSGAVLPGDELTFYLPVGGTFGTHIGADAAGTWTLETYDGVFGETGSFSGWDLQFIHRPPDNNGNGVPDICE
jgi:hypothetical protein